MFVLLGHFGKISIEIKFALVINLKTIVNFGHNAGVYKTKNNSKYAHLGSLRSRDRDSGNLKPGENGHFCSANFTYRCETWMLLKGGGGGAWSQSKDFVQKMII